MEPAGFSDYDFTKPKSRCQVVQKLCRGSGEHVFLYSFSSAASLSSLRPQEGNHVLYCQPVVIHSPCQACLSFQHDTWCCLQNWVIKKKNHKDRSLSKFMILCWSRLKITSITCFLSHSESRFKRKSWRQKDYLGRGRGQRDQQEAGGGDNVSTFTCMCENVNVLYN